MFLRKGHILQIYTHCAPYHTSLSRHAVAKQLLGN